MRLAVVGGGITGLAAAWEGLRQGAEVVLLEASPQLGGKIRTDTADGRVVEHGPDSFVAYRPAALDLILELGLEGDVITTRGAREVYLRRDGRFLPLPRGIGLGLPSRLLPFVTTPTLRLRDKARATLDLVLPRQLGPGDTSIGCFLNRRVGEGMVRGLVEPLLGGVYGASVDELSLDAVLPTLREDERTHRSLLLASLARGRAQRVIRGAESPFRTLASGLGGLVDRLAEQLRAGGADLRVGAPVSALHQDSDGRTRLAVGDETVVADAVVLAVDPATAARLVAPFAPSAASALAAIPLASTTVVTLAYPQAAFPARVTSHGWLEADPAPISGATISSAKWAGRAPADEVLIRAFVPERLGAIAHADDDQVLATTRRHVEAVLSVTREPIASWVTRWQRVMPKYTVGHLDRVAAVESALAPTTWRLAGSALHGVGLPECIADGRRQAVAVLGAAQRGAATNLGSHYD